MASPTALAGDAGQVAGAVRPSSTSRAASVRGASSSPPSAVAAPDAAATPAAASRPDGVVPTSGAPDAAAPSPSAAASWYAPVERRRSRWARRRTPSAAAVGPASWFAAQSVADAPGAAGPSASPTRGMA